MMNQRRIAGTALAALAAAAPQAHADFVFTLAPSPIIAPAAVGFSNSTSFGTLTPGTITASPATNFKDIWNFALASGADVGAFVGSLNFTDGNGNVTVGISNLQLALLGPNGTIQGWSSSITNTGIQQVFSIIAPTNFFAPGNYALQVRGLLEGPTSAYAGTLQAVSAVPLPATAPLLGAGLAFAGSAWRRRRADRT